MEFAVFIEIPKGGRNKYELDQHLGRIRLDRTLFTATCFPADYGFIEDTLGLDDEPLDAVVLVEEPTFPGCWVQCRPIGMFRMIDEAGCDDKIICIPVADIRQEHLRDIADMSEFHKLEIQHFFQVYKEIEPGKSVLSSTSWAPRLDAEAEITEALRRAAARTS
jgi:inorganic pyrophosphatase